MVRTNDKSARKASGAKMPSKVAAQKSGVRSKGPGSRYKPRPTPSWQKGIGEFFAKESGSMSNGKSSMMPEHQTAGFSGNLSAMACCASGVDSEEETKNVPEEEEKNPPENDGVSVFEKMLARSGGGEKKLEANNDEPPVCEETNDSPSDEDSFYLRYSCGDEKD